MTYIIVNSKKYQNEAKLLPNETYRKISMLRISLTLMIKVRIGV